jgi:hypothetical protein
MSTYPDLRPSVTGHYPPTITDVPPGVPVLGEHLFGAKGKGLLCGWVEPPVDGVWRPESLLWTPPGTKALDLAGEIVDAQKVAMVDSHVWVTSQLRLRDRWLEMMRQKVLAGTMKLNAALAKMLGMEFSDSVALKGPSESPATGPQAEYRRFLAMQNRGIH